MIPLVIYARYQTLLYINHFTIRFRALVWFGIGCTWIVHQFELTVKMVDSGIRCKRGKKRLQSTYRLFRLYKSESMVEINWETRVPVWIVGAEGKDTTKPTVDDFVPWPTAYFALNCNTNMRRFHIGLYTLFGPHVIIRMVNHSNLFSL